MQTSLHGGCKGSPPPPTLDRNQEQDNCSEGDSEGEDHPYLPHLGFALPWHAYVGNVMQLRLWPAQDEKPIFCHDFLS